MKMELLEEVWKSEVKTNEPMKIGKTK